MGNFSKEPQPLLAANLAKGYVGVRIEQGVPLLDRDLNLLGDLLGSNLRAVLERYVGNGSLEVGALAISEGGAPYNDFVVAAGTCVVGGLVVQTGSFTYASQPDVPPLEAPSQGVTRTDAVYLDVWLEEVGADLGVDLDNLSDVGRRTAVRLRPTWRVRVAEFPATVPTSSPATGHAYYKLAELKRSGSHIAAAQIVDRRVTRLNLADLVQRVNALEASCALMNEMLQPAFSELEPFDAPSGYVGRAVVLRGRNFDLGTVTVDLLTSLQTGWELPIIGEPQANAITVRLPNMIGDDAAFRVNTSLGSTTSPNTFRYWGVPVWAVPAASPGVVATSPFTLYGSSLDCPGLAVQYKYLGVWYTLAINPGSATKTQITAIAPPYAGTSYEVRARNESMAANTYSASFTLTTVP